MQNWVKLDILFCTKTYKKSSKFCLGGLAMHADSRKVVFVSFQMVLIPIQRSFSFRHNYTCILSVSFLRQKIPCQTGHLEVFQKNLWP